MDNLGGRVLISRTRFGQEFTDYDARWLSPDCSHSAHLHDGQDTRCSQSPYSLRMSGFSVRDLISAVMEGCATNSV